MGKKPMRILIVGAGKSAGFAIEYLAKRSESLGAEIWVMDRQLKPLQEGFGTLPGVTYVTGDVNDAEAMAALIEPCQWVISLLPASMHMPLAKLAVAAGANFATASYESEEMRGLEPEIKAKNLLVLNEMGLDPGIDHLSAIQLLDELREKGEQIQSFESHCGGLVQVEDCKDNPWQYKFTWNPMNVIRAGQGAPSTWLEKGQVQQCVGNQVFNSFRSIQIEGSGTLQAYPNRDSLAYVEAYGLESAHTVLRGTLRRDHFCQAWQQLVQWGWVSDQALWPESVQTYQQAFQSFSGYASIEAWSQESQHVSAETRRRIQDIPLDDERELPSRIPAECLLALLEPRWKLESSDRDEVIMVHRVQTHRQYYQSSMVVHGTSAARTAMAKTVGLTLAMAVELAITKPGLKPGLHRPMSAYWYEDLLPMLSSEGIEFRHQEVRY
ncbi:MAG: saccharopine dehydrogenase NADP-binding domain-containing protein [Bacteroidetes bacterium]|nr:saccharopine dehydrogenase NADP-binding domain-containing protein [Bacteroidota bacterium]MDA1111875.1 saccharopine dehydrogenase NADP-binding domain-containing protein [Bacteroidota bacterium]